MQRNRFELQTGELTRFLLKCILRKLKIRFQSLTKGCQFQSMICNQRKKSRRFVSQKTAILSESTKNNRRKTSFQSDSMKNDLQTKPDSMKNTDKKRKNESWKQTKELKLKGVKNSL